MADVAERYVRQQTTARTSTSNTTAADIGFETTVLEDGVDWGTWAADEIGVGVGGKFVYIADIGQVELAGSTRAVGTHLPVVNGTLQTPLGLATHRYLRNSGGNHGASIGMAILDLADDDAVGVRNPGALTYTDAVGNYATNASAGGALQLLKLPDSGKYCHMERDGAAGVTVANTNANATRPWEDSTATFTKLTFDTTVADADGMYSAGDVTLDANKKYLVVWSGALVSGSGSRFGCIFRLNIGGVVRQYGTGYHRNTSHVGPPACGMYLHETGGSTETLYLEATAEIETGSVSPAHRYGSLQVIELPDSAEWLHVDNGAADSLTTALAGTSTWYKTPLSSTYRADSNSRLSLDAANNAVQNDAGETVAVLAIGSHHWDRDSTSSGTRKMPWSRWDNGGTPLAYGVAGAYSRGQQGTVDTWLASYCAAALLDLADGADLALEVNDPASGANADMGIYGSTNRHYLSVQVLDLASLDATPTQYDDDADAVAELTASVIDVPVYTVDDTGHTEAVPGYWIVGRAFFPTSPGAAPETFDEAVTATGTLDGSTTDTYAYADAPAATAELTGSTLDDVVITEQLEATAALDGSTPDDVVALEQVLATAALDGSTLDDVAAAEQLEAAAELTGTVGDAFEAAEAPTSTAELTGSTLDTAARAEQLDTVAELTGTVADDFIDVVTEQLEAAAELTGTATEQLDSTDNVTTTASLDATVTDDAEQLDGPASTLTLEGSIADASEDTEAPTSSASLTGTVAATVALAEAPAATAALAGIATEQLDGTETPATAGHLTGTVADDYIDVITEQLDAVAALDGTLADTAARAEQPTTTASLTGTVADAFEAAEAPTTTAELTGVIAAPVAHLDSPAVTLTLEGSVVDDVDNVTTENVAATADLTAEIADALESPLSLAAPFALLGIISDQHAIAEAPAFSATLQFSGIDTAALDDPTEIAASLDASVADETLTSSAENVAATAELTASTLDAVQADEQLEAAAELTASTLDTATAAEQLEAAAELTASTVDETLTSSAEAPAVAATLDGTVADVLEAAEAPTATGSTTTSSTDTAQATEAPAAAATLDATAVVVLILTEAPAAAATLDATAADTQVADVAEAPTSTAELTGTVGDAFEAAEALTTRAVVVATHTAAAIQLEQPLTIGTLTGTVGDSRVSVTIGLSVLSTSRHRIAASSAEPATDIATAEPAGTVSTAEPSTAVTTSRPSTTTTS